jgi:Phosphodiester glycosidase/FlgD Ig-like domain
VLVSGATAAGTDQVQALPGVSYEQYTDLTPHGPVSYTVIELPAPATSQGALANLGPVLPGGTLTAPTESVPQIEHDDSNTATLIGINGDFPNANGTRVSGIVVSGGALEHTPSPARSSIGFTASGSMLVGRLSFAGTWQGTGQRRPVAAINQAPGNNQTVLYTPAYGASTPAVAGSSAVVLEPFPTAQVDTDLKASVSDVADGSGPTPIPPDGAVLVATGTAAAKLTAEAPQGTNVTTRLTLPSAWSSVTSALGGGPLLVKGGHAVFHTTETFDVGDLSARDARAAVGQLADGQLLLVAVDGGHPGSSVGMTNYELAQAMVKLGAVTAAGLQYGNAVTAAFDGTVLNRPKTGAPAKVHEALLYQYAGVYAPPPPAPFVTAATAKAGEQLQYRVVRPSTVTASVVDPNGVAQTVDTGQRDAGTYRFPWTTFGAEGTYHWRVQATDDLGRQSTADVTFTYDLTLSGLAVPKSAAPATGLKVGFTLSRPASVTLQIETPRGLVVASEPAVQLPAGAASLTWPGATTAGGTAPNGSYVARVIATSEIGTSDAAAIFTWRS